MTKWDRNTPWRQGHLLTAEAVAALGLAAPDSPETAAVVVVSHDCDLAQPSQNEPMVEIVVGRFLETPPNGNYTHNKNVRRLHTSCSAGTAIRVVELEATARRSVCKDSTDTGPGLAEYEPSGEVRLAPRERNVLQRWLAARYRRAAFPDEFDRRLKEETGVSERLAKAFKESGEHVTAVFFDIDSGRELSRRGPDDPYEVFVTLLYATDVDPVVAETAAKAAAERVTGIFQSRCLVERAGVRVWQWLELHGVEVVSDQALSYADSLHLTPWHADHISLRTDPEQPMIDR